MRSKLHLKRNLTLAASLFVGFLAQSQVATTYNFSQTAGTYTPITGGTVLADSVTNIMDDEVYPVSIPAFMFDGTPYSTVYVSTNGFISFGAPMEYYDFYPVSENFTVYNGAISAFGTDLNEAEEGPGTRNISTAQVGNEFVIQWQNVRRYGIDGERLSFQIRLNTVTNAISIVYDALVPGDSQDYPEIGLRGPDNDFATNVNNREVISTTGAWLNSTAGTSETSTCFLDSNDPATVPAAGTTFTWTSLPDVQLQNIVFSSANQCYGDTETISMIVKNSGGTTIDFSVTPLTLDLAVSGTNPTTFTPVTVNTGTLAAGSTQTIQVTASYNMSLAGATYDFEGSISMTGDSRTGNNELERSFFNYKPTAVYADATACFGEDVTLTGTTEAFEVVFSNNDLLPIPDGGAAVYSNIVVSNTGVATASSVVVTIGSLTHTYTSDLTITLIAPDGSEVDLSSERGTDADFTGTVFSDAATTAISAGDNPFTGNFQPDSPLSGLTGSANGTWQLRILDGYSIDAGTLNNWSISFPGANGITTYSWTPATSLSSATIANPVATPASTETYTLTITDNRGCTNSTDVEVVIKDLPTVTAISNAAGNTICEGESVILTGGGTATVYTWNNGVTNGTAFVPTATNTYTVTGTGVNNCTDTATITITVDECLGLNEAAQAVIEVYPNPGKGVFTISATDADQLANMQIMDAQGKSVAFDRNTNGTNFVIDLSQVENGIYFLTGTLNGTQFVSRLVKQ
ncbi:Transglutaminase-activating metalloprotease precursor [compost metagenome]